MIRLSILIPTMHSRVNYLTDMVAVLTPQLRDNVEVLVNADDGTQSIGDKRNELLSDATGEYLCFVDDDDVLSRDYVALILEALAESPTHCDLMGVYTEDGGTAKMFHHSNTYKDYRTNEEGVITYERYPNHLNVIKSTIAKKYSFPSINHGEDTDWATQLRDGGELIDEACISKVLYHYKFRTNK